jgi:DNA-directed RNA polymerase specialized sigma24 family protein
MCDCSSFIAVIKQGGAGLERALLQIAKGEDQCGFKKVAAFVFKRYCYCCRDSYTWEDLLFEALLRYIESIKRGREPYGKDCRPFFFQICKHVCWEWCRKEKPRESDGRPVSGDDDYSRGWIEDLVVLMEMNPEWKEAALKCLNNASEKDRILLEKRYFDTPPVKDNEALAAALFERDYKVNPKNIPAEIANSLGRFRLCLKRKLKP